MSRSQFVSFKDEGFWAFDVVVATYIKFLVDVAEERLKVYGEPWLKEVIQNWRLYAVISDYGFPVCREESSVTQIEIILGLVEKTNEIIKLEEDIPADTLTWDTFFENHYIDLRGVDPVPIKPIVNFGEGVRMLLLNRFPLPPVNHRQFYSLNDEVDIISV